MSEQIQADELFKIGRRLAEVFLGKLRETGRLGNTEHQRAMLFFFCKAYKSYQAVQLLWQNGFVEDAYTLARSIYEIRLQVILMSGDPVQRSKLFTDHWFKTGYGTLQIMKRQFPKRDEELKQGEGDIRAGATASGRTGLLHDAEAAERSIRKKWWGGSIKGLLKQLNVGLEVTCKSLNQIRQWDYETEYDIIYSQLSDYTHSGVRLFHKFLTEECYRPTKSAAILVPFSVTDWLSQIVGYAARAFQIDLDKIVAEEQQKAQSIAKR